MDKKIFLHNHIILLKETIILKEKARKVKKPSRRQDQSIFENRIGFVVKDAAISSATNTFLGFLLLGDSQNCILELQESTFTDTSYSAVRNVFNTSLRGKMFSLF